MRPNTTQRSVRIVVAIAVLVVAAGASISGAVVGPEQEPNDGQENAQGIALGEAVTGELTSGDVDWFRFPAESGRVINVSASTDDVGNTNFEVLDANGNQIASVSGLTAQSAQAGTTSTYTGTYYLRVERRFTDRGGEYDFTVETTETDAFEPNEDRANATKITDEEEVEGEITIGDTDFFKITTDRGDAINVSAFADSSGTTNFQLYDRNGTFLTGEDGISGGFARVNRTATYTGEYYVRVTSRFADTYGAAYNLTVDLPGEPSAETQPDETPQEDETDSGFPVVLVVVGIAVVLILLLVVWRFRDRDDASWWS